MFLKKQYIRQALVHLVLWSSFFGLLMYPFVAQLRPMPSDFPVRLLATMALYYFNYFYLLPKLLLKKKTLIYIVISLLIIVVISLLIRFWFPWEFPRQLPYKASKRFYGPLARQLVVSLVTFVIPFIISVVLRIYVEWRRNDDLRKIVENEKIYSELQFLKTQLKPHFLFNSLNAIYSLSVKKSPDTSEAIINLSELMRYMLYEADKDFVPLVKELEYIQNYVQLQRLRLSDSENVTLKISGEDRGRIIPPLLFISFIENAFKYGTDYKGKTNVKINLLIAEESIHLTILNKIGTFKKKTESSGVGLENVRNRLKLLYPDSHKLNVKNDGETYLVDLVLNIGQRNIQI
ncbi:sensor histidine kinase [Maribacter sp. HTCC2170]|uniref:sensor histidine kinase n=1 Tax=Maribacter sp. (strain HTCC2170 / KCCM 42371) TaxID=313603 RepID=UPI00006B484C|nr:histidine kinase [Maribacter sp. HTCC2170]EAR01898.1 putative two-component system sensor protein, no kinase domain [Maribacter sp. HTCC2170]